MHIHQASEARTSYKKFWRDLTSGRFVSMVRETAKGETVSGAREVFNITRPLYAQRPDREIVYGLFLDCKNKILSMEELFSGTITHASIHPREIVKEIIRLHAVALVMTHNHPSGNPEPSSADIDITRKVFMALASIDATLHDHIIVGETYCSLSDEGLMANFQKEYTCLVLDGG